MIAFLSFLEDFIINIIRYIFVGAMIIVGGHGFLRFLYPKNNTESKNNVQYN